MFSNQGKVYRLRGHEIPMKDRTARGTAAVNLVPLAPNESITAIIATPEFSPDQYLVFATAQGQVKKTAMSEYDKSRREGFIAINLRDGDELVRVVKTSGHDDLFEVTRNGMTIRFNEEDVRSMGRDAAGVRGIRLRQGDIVVSCDVADDDETDILIVTDAGYGKRTKLERFNRQARGGQGVRGIRLTNVRGTVVGAFMIGLDEEILLVSSGGDRDPHRGAGDRVAGPRRHGGPGDEPRRRPDRGGGGPGGGGGGRRGLAARPAAPARTSPLEEGEGREGPDPHLDLADDEGSADGTPEPAVARVRPVVPHDEVVVRRHPVGVLEAVRRCRSAPAASSPAPRRGARTRRGAGRRRTRRRRRARASRRAGRRRA